MVEIIEMTDPNQKRAIAFQLKMMGKPYAAIADYLDITSNPTLNGFFDYMDQEKSSYNAQTRWDISQRKDPISSRGSLDGEGYAAMMNRLPRRS